MAHEHILVVDDDKDILRLVSSYLQQAGFVVMLALDGETALHTVRRERPDLLLLDLMLPGIDGWDITSTIRSDASVASIPIIMLTAKVDDNEKILGLELGADDYITKPFNPREMLARVRAALRRTQWKQETAGASTLQVGELRMDVGRHEVALAGQKLELTRTEFLLLKVLMEAPGYAFTRNELVERVLGYSYDGAERALDTHVKNLRRKLGDEPKDPVYIRTVYGVGYQLAEVP
jgi:two-component system, OmpR family, alkaline phosphatase synthesis response regulator PhoP